MFIIDSCCHWPRNTSETICKTRVWKEEALRWLIILQGKRPEQGGRARGQDQQLHWKALCSANGGGCRQCQQRLWHRGPAVIDSGRESLEKARTSSWLKEDGWGAELKRWFSTGTPMSAHTVCNSDPKGSTTLCWLLRAQHAHSTQTYTHPHT